MTAVPCLLSGCHCYFVCLFACESEMTMEIKNSGKTRRKMSGGEMGKIF
jgi:hypothetical protein